MDFELDCKQVVDAVKGGLKIATEFGVIISSCRDTLFHLHNCSLSFIQQQAKCVAHSLARAAQSFTSHHLHFSIPIIGNTRICYSQIRVPEKPI